MVGMSTGGAVRPASERAAAWLRTGIGHLAGHPDGPALLPPGNAPDIADALAQRIVAAAALGGIELALDGAALLGQRTRFRHLARRGRSSAGGGARLIRTADGWAAVSAARDDDAWLLAAAAGVVISEPVAPWSEVEAWAVQQTGAQVAEMFTMLGIAGAPVGRHPQPPAPELSALPGTPGEALVRPARPVTGLRVLDFSALWAGPLAAWLLGRAGAHVTTVESAARPDGARRGDPDLHAMLHEGHELLVIDPADEGDRRHLRDLASTADIVIEASRPRALRAWGLDAQAHADRGGTWVSITAGGRGGDRVGFGDDVAAAAGLLAVDGDGAPVFVGDALADPLTGLTAAALVASAEAGVVWDCSMTAIVAATLGPDAFTGITGTPSPALETCLQGER